MDIMTIENRYTKSSFHILFFGIACTIISLLFLYCFISGTTLSKNKCRNYFIILFITGFICIFSFSMYTRKNKKEEAKRLIAKNDINK